MCICITESLCCTYESNATLLINYTPIKKIFFKEKNLKKKRMDICTCTTETLCCTPATITTLLINYSPI